MRSNRLRVFECATIAKIGGNAGRPKRVVANRGKDTCHCGAAADQAPGVSLGHRLFRSMSRITLFDEVESTAFDGLPASASRLL
jgi:hypothetical protein